MAMQWPLHVHLKGLEAHVSSVDEVGLRAMHATFVRDEQAFMSTKTTNTVGCARGNFVYAVAAN